jgi:hypothetical protein
MAEKLLQAFRDESNPLPTDVQIAIGLQALTHAVLAIYVGGAG